MKVSAAVIASGGDLVVIARDRGWCGLHHVFLPAQAAGSDDDADDDD